MTRPAAAPEAPAAAGARDDVSHMAVVHREIRRRIVDNVYPPGSHLPIKTLVDDFGMSRTPIRDALIRLEKEGLVEFVPHRGVRILPMSAGDMREIYQILAGLEATAITLICESRPDQEQLAPLRRAVEDMERAVARDDLREWADADAAFHAVLVDLAGSRRLAELVQSFNTQTYRARLLTLRLRSKPERSTARHREVFESIREGDSTRAREVHLVQRFRSARELVELLASLNVRHL